MRKAYLLLAAAAVLVAGCTRDVQPQAEAWPAIVVAQVSAKTVSGHPLSIASMRAASACSAIDQTSLDSCSNQLGRKPEHTIARAATRAAFEAHNAFISACKDKREHCQADAEYLIEQGFAMVGK